MAINDTKILPADMQDKGVTGLPDIPGYSTADMQAKLDELVRDVAAPKHNALIDALGASTGAAEIGSTNGNVQQELDAKAVIADVLAKDNTTAFTPSADYHPATKKYVDDTVIEIGAGDMAKAVYDTNNDGTVNDSDKLGGELPSAYMLASQYATGGVIDEAAGGTGQSSFPHTYQPNLLINSGFAVWQRGTSFSALTAGAYTADRWKCSGSGTAEKNGGLKVTGTLTVSYFMESADFAAIDGKSVVLSYKYAGDEVYTQTLTASAAVFPEVTGGNKIFELAVSDKTLEWVKLEIGNRFTGFSPKSYAAELADCQRYYQTGMYKTTGAFTYNGAWRYFHSNPFPVKMRAVPTITVTFLDVGYVASPPIANISLDATADCIHQVYYSGASGTASAKNNLVLEYIANAEIQV